MGSLLQQAVDAPKCLLLFKTLSCFLSELVNETVKCGSSSCTTFLQTGFRGKINKDFLNVQLTQKQTFSHKYSETQCLWKWCTFLLLLSHPFLTFSIKLNYIVFSTFYFYNRIKRNGWKINCAKQLHKCFQWKYLIWFWLFLIISC